MTTTNKYNQAALTQYFSRAPLLLILLIWIFPPRTETHVSLRTAGTHTEHVLGTHPPPRVISQSMLGERLMMRASVEEELLLRPGQEAPAVLYPQSTPK